MLKDKRQYVIDKINIPLIKFVLFIAKRITEIIKENTKHPNTHVWIDVWDRFEKENDGRVDVFKALRRIWLYKNEVDGFYRDRVNRILELWLEEVFKGNWKPRSLDHPSICWKVDPNIRGKGYEFLAERYYHKEKYL